MSRARAVAEAMVALGPDRAAALMRSLDEPTIVDLTAEIQRVGVLSESRSQEALRTLASGLVETPVKAGDRAFATQVLREVLDPARAEQIIEETAPDRASFGFIEQGAPELVAKMLSGEPRGVAALALSSVGPARSAQILKLLPEEMQPDLAMRIATIAPVAEDVFDLVESDLRARMGPATSDQSLRRIEGLDALVDILGQSSRKIEKRVLEQIRERDETLASRIREALFAFEDIAALDNRAIQEVLKSVDAADLSFALKNADEAIQERFMSNLSERARANLVEEMDYLQSVAASDVRAAQKRIVATVRELEESGLITIERGGGDEDDDEEDDGDA